MKQEDLSKVTQPLSVNKYIGNTSSSESIEVVVEKPIQLMINETLIATVMCSPLNLEELLIGFLFGQGIIDDVKQVKRTLIDDGKGLAWAEVENEKPLNLTKTIITSGCTGGIAFDNFNDLKPLSDNQFDLNNADITFLMNEMTSKAEIYKLSGGIHCAALCSSKEILFITEDIGRHNTIDKVIGFMVDQKIDSRDKMILTTGRLSLEAVIKTARAQIQVLATRSTPTSLAVEMAKKLNIQLFGYVRNAKLIRY